MKFSYPIIPLGINPSIGIGSTQGPHVDPIPILGLIPNGIIGYENFTVMLGPHSNLESLLKINYLNNIETIGVFNYTNSNIMS